MCYTRQTGNDYATRYASRSSSTLWNDRLASTFSHGFNGYGLFSGVRQWVCMYRQYDTLECN